jgi:glycosyltransferase involved in cell wall biosynthesis
VGPLVDEMRAHLGTEGVLPRCRFAGILQKRDLVDAYAAMDVFAFASHTESQGIVLVEAMAAGAPVVAVDASGVREVVQDGLNGRMLPVEDEEVFASALTWACDMPPAARQRLSRAARRSARRMSMEECAAKLESVYSSTAKRKAAWQVTDDSVWASALRRIQAEWKLLSTVAHAAGTALVGDESSGAEGGAGP